MMKMIAFIFLSSIGVTGLLLVMNFIALSPEQIERPAKDQVKPIAVKMPDQPPAKEIEPPAREDALPTSALTQLAPESIGNQIQDLGAGVAFGSSGMGPGVAGRGGFSSEAQAMISENTKVTRPPKAISKTSPEYPQEARSKNVSGFVVASVLVAVNGQVESIRIEESEPKGFFDQAALKALRAWKFEPALNQGKTVVAWSKQRIKFELN